MSENKRRIVKDAGFYSIATVVTQLISIVSAILMRRFLGPAQVGVWALVQMVLTYAEYSNLGASNGITREIPFYQGRGDAAKVESLKNTAFYFSVATSFAASACVLGYAFWMRRSLPSDLFWGLVICSGLLLLQRVNGLLISTMRAFKQFELASHQMIWSALVNSVLVAALSYRFQLYGFMAAMALSFLFNIIYIFKGSGLSFRYSLDVKEISSLLSYGFPLLMLAFFGTLFETIDKIMITKYLGLENLGLYSIALMTATYLYSLPNAVGVVMIPNIHEKFGRTGNKSDLREFLDKSDEVFSGLMPMFIGLAWFVVPAAIEILLPKFVGGIAAMRWLALSVYFLAASQAYSQTLYVFRLHHWFFAIFPVSAIPAIGLNLIFIRAGWGIEGVAIATAAAMAAHFLIVYGAAAPQVRAKSALTAAGLIILGKFLLMLAVLLLLKRVDLKNSLITGAVQTVLMAAIYSVPLWKLNKKFGFLDVLFKRSAAGGVA